jgi:TPR repeat protein
MGLLLSSSLLGVEAALAEDCRQALRPLLSQLNPEASRLQQARLLCEREARNGDADATYQLSLFHLGLTDWAPETAIPMMRTAANQGVPEAQYWLAWQYEAGPLVEDDPVRALQWYQAAGNGQHRLALQRLADAYANGELGLAVSPTESIRLRALAASCSQ